MAGEIKNTARNKNRTHRGYISMNILIMFIFISMAFVSICLVLADTGRYMIENTSLIKGDYKSEEADEIVKLNIYRAIESAYKNSQNEDEFFSLLECGYGDEFEKIKNMEYFQSDHIIVQTDKRKVKYIVSEDKRFADFYIYAIYTDETMWRYHPKKCRIYNPYKYAENKKKNKTIQSKEFKKLFRYIY